MTPAVAAGNKRQGLTWRRLRVVLHEVPAAWTQGAESRYIIFRAGFQKLGCRTYNPGASTL